MKEGIGWTKKDQGRNEQRLIIRMRQEASRSGDKLMRKLADKFQKADDYKRTALWQKHAEFKKYYNELMAEEYHE